MCAVVYPRYHCPFALRDDVPKKNILYIHCNQEIEGFLIRFGYDNSHESRCVRVQCTMHILEKTKGKECFWVLCSHSEANVKIGGGDGKWTLANYIKSRPAR